MQAGLETLQKRLYQLIIARLEGDKIKLQRYREHIISLVHKGIGGFILFGGIKEEIKKFIQELQSMAEIPLFISSDIERGVGQQLKGATSFPCQMAIASAINDNKKDDVPILQMMLKAVAHESIDIGINMPLIPVMDVNKNPDNPIICTRAFSDKPERVAWFGCQYIRALQFYNLLCCTKHFPGHGDTSIDSHISLPIINKTKVDLMRDDIMPFLEAIKANVASIMIGHLYIPELDSKPASLSKKIIDDLLKKELGFEGLILTDALNMNALKDWGDIPTNCINADADILLHPEDADLTVKELMHSIKVKKLNEEHINRAIKKILDAKRRIPLIRKTKFDYSSHQRISRQITEISLCLINQKADILPINDLSKVQLIFVGEANNYDTSILKRHFDTKTKNPNQITIFAIFTTVSAWKGRSGINEEERDRVNSMIKKAKNSIVVSFGSPYVLRHFSDADILISAYESNDESQRALIKCLKGELDFKGQLPVDL